MKDRNQIIEFILSRLQDICSRPLMYGGTSEGVELILRTYFEIWAFILSREKDYQQALQTICQQQKVPVSQAFGIHFQKINPDASEDETVHYVVGQWKKVMASLRGPLALD